MVRYVAVDSSALSLRTPPLVPRTGIGNGDHATAYRHGRSTTPHGDGPGPEPRSSVTLPVVKLPLLAMKNGEENDEIGIVNDLERPCRASAARAQRERVFGRLGRFSEERRGALLHQVAVWPLDAYRVGPRWLSRALATIERTDQMPVIVPPVSTVVPQPVAFVDTTSSEDRRPPAVSRAVRRGAQASVAASRASRNASP